MVNRWCAIVAAVGVPGSCAFVTRSPLVLSAKPATQTSLFMGGPIAHSAALDEVNVLMEKARTLEEEAKTWEKEAEALEEQARALEKEMTEEDIMEQFTMGDEKEQVKKKHFIKEEETVAGTMEEEIVTISSRDEPIHNRGVRSLSLKERLSQMDVPVQRSHS
mmetsp:Transcript_26628/g.57256  ORF Transcript_26628/g.57256 Transcript_26628/m.57256 type:complete len:163 (-) Transcript_26628:388-876(-)